MKRGRRGRKDKLRKSHNQMQSKASQDHKKAYHARTSKQNKAGKALLILGRGVELLAMEVTGGSDEQMAWN